MLVNETIDDSDPRIIYDSHDSPQNETWTTEIAGYHAASYYFASVVYTFQGSAIYVSCLRDITGVGNISVTVDDIPLGPFNMLVSSPAERGPAIVFQKTDLEPTLNHTIIVRKVPDDNVFQPNYNSTLFFGSFIVTHDTDAPAATAAASHPIPTTSLDVIIDDQDSRVVYSSPWQSTHNWNTYSTYKGTMKKTSTPYQPAYIYFKGSAVRVTSVRWWCGGNYVVSLDGLQSGPYSLFTNDPTRVKPEVIFSALDLDPQSIHYLAVSFLPDPPGFISRIATKSYFQIDSFIITGGNIVDPNTPGLPSISPMTSPTPNPLPATTESAQGPNQGMLAGAIIAGIVGGIATISLLILALYFLRRKRARDSLALQESAISRTSETRKGKSKNIFQVEPFVIPPASPTFPEPLMTARTEKSGCTDGQGMISPAQGVTVISHPSRPLMLEYDRAIPLSPGEISPTGPWALNAWNNPNRAGDTAPPVQEQIEELRQVVRRLQERDNINPPIYEEPR